MLVPRGCCAGRGSRACPAATSTRMAISPSPGREVSAKRDTDATEASASPRKPMVATCSRSSKLAILLVACEASANGKSSATMPPPSSRTRIKREPPASISTSMRVLPASRLFSTSSLTTDAGRSMTSPAAIWLTRSGGSGRIEGMTPRIRAIGDQTSSLASAAGDGQYRADLHHVAGHVVGRLEVVDADAVAAGDAGQGVAASDLVDIAMGLAGLGQLAATLPRLHGKPGPWRRRLREVGLDTAQHGTGQFLLIGGALQLALARRVGDERGFDQDRRNVGRAQHHEVGALDMVAMCRPQRDHIERANFVVLRSDRKSTRLNSSHV